MLPYTDEQRRMHLLCKLYPELQQAILQHSEVPTTRDGMITLALRLEDVRKMKTQRDPAEKAKGESSKPESGSRAESAPKRATSESKNKGAWPKGRGRKSGESSSSSKPAKPDKDKPKDKRDLSEYTCFNCDKKGHLANICPEPKKAVGPS
jgi:hypothetical protein